VLRWLESEHVRLVRVDGEWTCPVGGAGRRLGADPVSVAAPGSSPATRTTPERRGLE